MLTSNRQVENARVCRISIRHALSLALAALGVMAISASDPGSSPSLPGAAMEVVSASPVDAAPVEMGEVPAIAALDETPASNAPVASPAAVCSRVIYDNTTTSGYWYKPGTSIEVVDFGTTTGGTVCQFSFAYATTLTNPGTIIIRFYSGTTTSVCPGTYLVGYSFGGLSGSPDGTPYAYSYTVTIAAGQEFNLPAGALGYGYTFDNANTGVFLATGGTGNQDSFWKSCALTWFGGPPNPVASFYMKVTAQDTTPADIRVEPLSLTLNCPSGAPSLLAQADPSSPAPAEKLIDAASIGQALADGQGLADVIVNLAPPNLLANTNFNDAGSLAALQKTVAQAQDAVLASLDKSEFKIGYRYANLASFSGTISQSGLTKLLQDPRVGSIEPVRVLEAHLAQGIPLMNATTARLTYNGAGMAIAICDTGIDYTHPMLGGGGFPNTKVIGGYDFGDNDANPMDCQGHGTCCAGLAAGSLGISGDYIGGVAHNAKLYALKMVAGCTGSATDAAMIAAWDWCVTHKNDNPTYPILVISTSFGGGRYFANCDGDSPGMTAAANNAVAAGITVLASSGNDGYCDSIAWPACISSVVSVGAVYDAAFGNYLPCINSASCAPKTATGGCATGYYATDVTAPDKVTSYSNAASFLDILAPANQAYTADIVGAGGYDAGNYTPGFGGTSAACPYAAGAVACLQQAAFQLTGGYLTPALVRSKVIATGDPKTDAKVAITKPRVNLGNAVASLTPCTGAILRIYNDGVADLLVTSITKPAWVTLNPAPPYLIAGGGSLPVCVTVDCSACTGADLDGTLAINSNDPDEATVNVAVHVNCPPKVTSAVSEKTHTGVGPFQADVTSSSATECRVGGPTKVIVTFSKAIQQVSGTNADVKLCSGTVNSLAVAGNLLTIQMAGVPDGTKLTICFPGIAASGAPLAVVTDTLCFGSLIGDVNQDGTVNILDLVTIRNNLNQATSANNFRSDVNTDGTINILDLVSVRNNLNKTITGSCLPACSCP